MTRERRDAGPNTPWARAPRGSGDAEDDDRGRPGRRGRRGRRGRKEADDRGEGGERDDGGEANEGGEGDEGGKGGDGRSRPSGARVGHGTGDDRATSTGSHAPPGWSANPSSWSQRLPIVGLSLVGVAVAGYLALFQVGVVGSVWEPLFGDGSRVVLTSGVSRLLPVPDAALGAVGYLLDAVTGAIGGRERWRTRPWIVIVFGLAVGPLGAVSIALVVVQPVVYGAWCTLCLGSAVISLAMIGPAMDELLASLQYLRRVADRGGPVWRAFLKGPRSPAVGGGA